MRRLCFIFTLLLAGVQAEPASPVDCSTVAWGRGVGSSAVCSAAESTECPRGVGCPPFCRSWDMRDYEEGSSEYHTAADPWVRGDIPFGWTGWFILEEAPGAGDYDALVSQYDTGNGGFYIGVQPSDYGPCPNCLLFYVGNAADIICAVAASTQGALVANSLYHFQASYIPAYVGCYISVNGGTLEYAARTGVAADSTTSLQFGAGYSGALHADARISRIVRFAGGIPTVGEQDAIYNYGDPLSCQESARVLNDITHCWPLDEASGNALESPHTGNGVDLTDTNDVSSATACVP